MVRNATHARQLKLMHKVFLACQDDPVEVAPTSEAAINIAGVLGVGDQSVQGWLRLYERLTMWLPKVWALCEAGRLDLHRAELFVDQAATLASDEERALFADDITAYLDRHDDPGTPVVRLSRTQLQRAAKWRAMKRERLDTELTYAEAFSRRRAWFRPDENGMASIGASASHHEAEVADYRLTLIARKRCQSDEQGRTLDQMRADTLVDLILGRIEVSALTSELEQDETIDGDDPADTIRDLEVGAFARPVINVTVSITTLLGLDDEPGMLSGDNPIPADLARDIALLPGSTWHRLLTDKHGQFLELSTTSYQPTKPIWRTVVARDRTCVWPGCCRPSVESQLDHRNPYPDGDTSTTNLWPLCLRHHRAKHTQGYTCWIEPDGTYCFQTRHGVILRSHPSENIAA